MTTQERATKEALAPLIEEGISVEGMALILGVSERTIDRAMVRHGYRAPIIRATPLTDAERDRILVLGGEGMPVCWIAEEVGRDQGAVSKVIGPMPERNKEWSSIWQYIRRRDALRELHDEFRPKEHRHNERAA